MEQGAEPRIHEQARTQSQPSTGAGAFVSPRAPVSTLFLTPSALARPLFLLPLMFLFSTLPESLNPFLCSLHSSVARLTCAPRSRSGFRQAEQEAAAHLNAAIGQRNIIQIKTAIAGGGRSQPQSG